MFIVIDSNMIIGEGYGNSAQFRFLLDTLNVLQNKLCVPRVVLEEVVAHFGRAYDRDYQKAVAGIDKLSRLLGRALPSPKDAIDNRSESASLRRRLEKQFESVDCRILDYPDTPHEALVKRATARRKPYKQNGKGYRDSLIWESTLSLATEVDAQIVLLSENIEDFSDGKGRLHPELIEDMVDRNLSECKIILISSMSEFMDNRLVPVLQENGEILTEIDQLLRLPEFVEEIRLAFHDTYPEVEWSSEELGLREEYETIILNAIGNISDMRVADARKLNGNRLLLSIKANLDCLFDVFLEKPNRFLIEDNRNVVTIEPEFDRRYAYAQMTMRIDGFIKLIVNDSYDLRGLEVLSLDPIVEDEELSEVQYHRRYRR